MRRIVVIIALCGSLGACVTAAELAQADDTKCLSYGVAKGSPAYVQCRMQLDHDRSERQVANNLSGHGGILAPIIAAANK